MVTSYRSTTGHLGTGSATSGTQTLSIARPTAGFDDALELPVSLDGVVRYAPTLKFGARFDIKILGYRVVDWELFQVPMTLPALERAVVMTSETPAHFALPVLDGLGEGARIDFASGPTQILAIRNRGELALTIDPASVPAGISVEPITIAPGASAQLRVTASDAAFSEGSSTCCSRPPIPTTRRSRSSSAAGSAAPTPAWSTSPRRKRAAVRRAAEPVRSSSSGSRCS